LTFELLVRPRIADKEVRIIQFRNQDDLADLTVKAYPNNEFHVFARVRGKDGKDTIKEAKVTGRNTKYFSLIAVGWDGATGKISLAVRSQDGGKSIGGAGGLPECPVLNEIHISEYNKDPKVEIKTEDKFAGDIVELAVWPFFMDWEPRSLQDQKIAEFYFIKPGVRYN
jgi:hypothetical protein